VTGTRVVVTESGFAGTIGGGAAEKQLVERATGHQGDAEIFRFRHTPSGGGTLCSGVQDFAIISLSPGNLEPVQSIVDTLENHRTGTLHLSQKGVAFEPGETSPHTFTGEKDSWTYSGPIGLEDTLYIIGGGQHVVDFDHIGNHVADGDHSWVVIMTFGHVHDQKVLEGLLGKNLAYLGLMGSEAKVRQMYAAMEADGIDEKDLESVQAPVGVSIGSHTPEEIAISIAAEIIALRNGR